MNVEKRLYCGHTYFFNKYEIVLMWSYLALSTLLLYSMYCLT